MIALFFKSIILNLYIKIKEVFYLSKLQKKYPNCEFYYGAKISNSVFGNYNTVFNDVIMDFCMIGDYSYVQKKTTIFNAQIGKFCSIASGVSIGPGFHDTNRVSTHPSFYDNSTPLSFVFAKEKENSSVKRTIIGDDVWIGERAILIDGVKIGTGAVIAAGAVVTKDVAAYSIVAGVPAKEIKKRFPDEVVLQLLSSKWWLHPEDWLKENYIYFHDIEAFLELIKTKQI